MNVLDFSSMSVLIQFLHISQFNYWYFLFPVPLIYWSMTDVRFETLFYFPLIFIFNIFTQLQAKNGIQEMECCSLESDWIYFHPDASGRIIHVGPNQVKWVFLWVTLKWKVAFGSIYRQVYFCQLPIDSIIEIISLLQVASSETGI